MRVNLLLIWLAGSLGLSKGEETMLRRMNYFDHVERGFAMALKALLAFVALPFALLSLCAKSEDVEA